MHGKLIDEVTWPSTEEESGQFLHSIRGNQLHLSATHHGDHDEFWILMSRKISGREISRYNVRYVKSIKWADVSYTWADI